MIVRVVVKAMVFSVVVIVVVTEEVTKVVRGCNSFSDCLTIRRLGFEYSCYSCKSKSPI